MLLPLMRGGGLALAEAGQATRWSSQNICAARRSRLFDTLATDTPLDAMSYVVGLFKPLLQPWF